MSASSLTGKAARALFDAAYVVPATAAVANPDTYASSDNRDNELGKVLAQVRRGLESLPPAQAHEPADGRKIDEDLEDSVLAANDAANAEPKPKIGGIQVYNRPSSIRKKMLLAV